MSFAGSFRDSADPQIHRETAFSTIIAYGILLIIFVYYVFQHINRTTLPLREVLCGGFVRIVPSPIVSKLDKEYEVIMARDWNGESRKDDPNIYATKNSAMRRIFGLGGAGILSAAQRARTLPDLGNVFKPRLNNAPPGLGNWDNSCYQNSILQGLASLESLSVFLDGVMESDVLQPTKSALRTMVRKLNNPENTGKTFWTPTELKSMSSWQQQDAQEYFSKISDEMEKDTKKMSKTTSSCGGLKELSHIGPKAGQPSSPANVQKPCSDTVDKLSRRSSLSQMPEELAACIARNPLEGLLAQRVGCQRCGFVEGLSLVPFNCLTVPLGRGWSYNVRSCLDDYTTLEPINGVECAKCTLLHAKKSLEQVLRSTNSDSLIKDSSSTTDILGGHPISLEERLTLVDKALGDEDFSDQALKRCQIPPQIRVSTTKTRQAVIARAPKSLVIHVNRSNFDELTGLQSKNLANVEFPDVLDLAPWCLGNAVRPDDSVESWNTNPSESMLSHDYAKSSNEDGGFKLKAVITHYGRHENGHYICYRKSPYRPKPDKNAMEESQEHWWRLSDESVSEVDEDFVLAQGGVFMLFYELPITLQKQSASSQPITADVHGETREKAQINKAAVSEVDLRSESIHEPEPIITTALPTPPPTPKQCPTNEEPSPSTSLQIIPKTTTTDIPSTVFTESLELPSPAVPPTRGKPSLSPEPSPKKDAIEPPQQQPLSRPAKENQPVSPASMRTAAPRNGRGSVSRAGKAMGSVAGFVQAN